MFEIKKNKLKGLFEFEENSIEINFDEFTVIVESLKDPNSEELLEELGVFTDSPALFAIPHDFKNESTYDWFVPNNLISIEELMEESYSIVESYEEQYKESIQKYRAYMDHGTSWAYFMVRLSISLDVLENVRIPLVTTFNTLIKHKFSKKTKNSVYREINYRLEILSKKALSKLQDIKSVLKD